MAYDAAIRRLEEWLDRLKRARLLLAIAAVVFGALWLFGLLHGAAALIAFATAVAVAAVLAVGEGASSGPRAAPSAPPEARAEPDLAAVLSGLPDPVIALDRTGAVAALNAPARALAPALRVGEPLSGGLRHPEVLDAVRRARAGEGPQRAEFYERVPIERWYEMSAAPLADGQLMLVAFRDLTPLRRVEEMRADFVANASHELRTPLAALSGFIETLQGPARDDPAARQRFLAIMQAQATRMARLIDDLLSLSRIELNAHLRPDKEVELVAIVRQVADGLQMLAQDRGVEIAVTAPQPPLIVLGDRDELLRVFENLVENALKYASSGKRVEITVAEGDEREARVAVRDYGPGIAPEHLPRLTERFYRVDVAESRAQGGTGLGLALVKHILNRHGGRLTVDSVLGQGATFAAHLPLVRAGQNPHLSTKT
jgi:two-component system phosphate regulon sensor histidine kinase PhoR